MVRKGAIYRIAMGARIKYGEESSVYICYLYETALGRREIVDVGLLEAPTRNTVEAVVAGDRELTRTEKAEFPWLETRETIKRGHEVPKFSVIRGGIPYTSHFEVQLTFHPIHRPARMEAESVFNSTDFLSEMGYSRGWQNLYI